MMKHISILVLLVLCAYSPLYAQTPREIYLYGDIQGDIPQKGSLELELEVQANKHRKTYKIKTAGNRYHLRIPQLSDELSLAFHIKKQPEIEPYRQTIQVLARDTIRCDLWFFSTEVTLDEVVVSESQQRGARSMRILRDTEETMIFVGKKSSVAMIDKMLVNKAANNTRQMFRNVSGIVIHEGGEGGLQLNIGARGLDPNRSANFSVRQNGYDISADPLGYPESYYTPNADDIKEIQVVRGASALQYGSQFGGMINFKLAPPADKKIEVKQHFSVGSYGFLGSYTRLSGTAGAWGYYASATLKKGDGYRDNSDFESYGLLGQLIYKPNPHHEFAFETTKYHYLEHQPGGLTDVMFREDPKQSNRERNWFLVDWNIATLRYLHRSEDRKSEINAYISGLYARRYALGYRNNRVSIPDDMTQPRDLQKGTFRNLSAEVRYLRRFHTDLSRTPSVWIMGAKYYQAANRGTQDLGSTGTDADFNPLPLPTATNFTEGRTVDQRSAYRYPNFSAALFSELSLRLGERWSLVPGIRLEQIHTAIHGNLTEYAKITHDMSVVTQRDDMYNKRPVFLYGLAAAYKMDKTELYGNITRNYRAVTFNDLRAINPGLDVDPNIKDESGYSGDIGIRSRGIQNPEFDISAFFLYYADRIGEYFRENPRQPATYHRYRTNIADAISYGMELAGSYDLNHWTSKISTKLRADIFANIAITGSRYLKSSGGYDVEGNEVEFVPRYNLKGGINIGYDKVKLSAQMSHLTYQYTDAVNEPMDLDDVTYGIFGAIPGYTIVDLNIGYHITKQIALQLSLQNIGNSIYMTRRATGYPGPGIIPSAPFNVMATLQLTL